MARIKARGESVPMVSCVPVRRKEPVEWGVDEPKATTKQ